MNYNEMFKNCESLTTLDLSSFKTSSITSLSDMFKGCKPFDSHDLHEFKEIKKAINNNINKAILYSKHENYLVRQHCKDILMGKPNNEKKKN